LGAFFLSKIAVETSFFSALGFGGSPCALPELFNKV
jgi:hypothetical protein